MEKKNNVALWVVMGLVVILIIYYLYNKGYFTNTFKADKNSTKGNDSDLVGEYVNDRRFWKVGNTAIFYALQDVEAICPRYGDGRITDDNNPNLVGGGKNVIRYPKGSGIGKFLYNWGDYTAFRLPARVRNCVGQDKIVPDYIFIKLPGFGDQPVGYKK